jgi:uncharacterized OB-fold protein
MAQDKTRYPFIDAQRCKKCGNLYRISIEQYPHCHTKLELVRIWDLHDKGQDLNKYDKVKI